jgi:hypothetical protein
MKDSNRARNTCLRFTALLCSLFAAVLTHAQVPPEPIPSLEPLVRVEGNSIVAELRWNYPRKCSGGYNWIRPGIPSTSNDDLRWSLYYGFFSPFGICPPAEFFVGTQTHRWNNLPVGKHRVVIDYIDNSSFLDCGLGSSGCPLPRTTRTFAFDAEVLPPQVPTMHFWSQVFLALVAAFAVYRKIGRKRSLESRNPTVLP